MSCTVLLTFELNLRLVWDRPILLSHQTSLISELSDLVLASPDQMGSSGLSLTLPVVRTEKQQKALVHLRPSRALQVPVHAGLRAALSDWPMTQLCFWVTILVVCSGARIDLAYMSLFCAAVCLKSYPSFHWLTLLGWLMLPGWWYCWRYSDLPYWSLILCSK